MVIIERDKWYFLAECGNCGRETVLGESPGPQQIAKPTIGTFSQECPHCGHKQTITPEQVQTSQGIYI
jgi:rRNA maturation protein Nop10